MGQCTVDGRNVPEQSHDYLRIVDRVLASGGDVELVHEDTEPARVGGVAARLRYPIPRAS